MFHDECLEQNLAHRCPLSDCAVIAVPVAIGIVKEAQLEAHLGAQSSRCTDREPEAQSVVRASTVTQGGRQTSDPSQAPNLTVASGSPPERWVMYLVASPGAKGGQAPEWVRGRSAQAGLMLDPWPTGAPWSLSPEHPFVFLPSTSPHLLSAPRPLQTSVFPPLPQFPHLCSEGAHLSPTLCQSHFWTVPLVVPYPALSAMWSFLSHVPGQA